MSGEVSKTKLDGLKDGVDSLLTKVNALIQAEAYAESLPIIGNKLATATPALETLTLLSNALRAAVDAVATISDLSTKTTTQVAQALNNELASRLSTLAGNANPFNGSVLATVDGSGNVVLAVDMGRTVNTPFTLGDLGMSGLGLALGGQGNAQLAYNLDFRIGADATGFWFDPSQSDLSIGAKVDLNGLSVGANLGILHFAVTNIQDNSPAADADTLSFNIGSVWSTNGLIRNFTTDIVDFKATGVVDLDLHLQGDLSNAALPSIAADFHVDWGFSQSLLNGASANSWSPATVGFTNVQYNLGSYVETVIKPIVDTLVPVLKPINEALAIFRTDFQGVLPGDWRVPLDFNHDGKVTLLDFLEKVGGIDTAPIAALIDQIDKIVDFAEFLVGKDFSDAGYNIGDYSTTFSAIQGAADALAQLNVTSAGFTGTSPTLGTFLSSLAAGNSTGFGAVAAGGSNGATLITEIVGSPTLSFPLIENPIQLIKLLIGQDVDLFKFDMPAINLGTGLDAQGNLTNPLTVFTFPIWPVPLVEVKVNVAAQLVADLAFGYDTAGLRYWMSQGSNLSNIADIFTHGFYLDDQRSGGTDIAEFVVRAAIELAVTASAGITIGGGGNIMGSIALNIADVLTTPDGKLHLSDFPTQFGIANPFAIFDVSGEVSAGVRFWVDWPFGNIFNYNSPRLPLLNFNTRQDATALGVSAAGNAPATPPTPPGLADIFTVSGTTGLWIAVGPLAGNRDIADNTDHGEIVQIGSGGAGKLAVAGFDKSQLFNLADFTTIQADGGNGNDQIVIDAGVTVAARMSGGQGNDYLEGGDANDQLYGGTEDDYLVGGAGNDRLDGEDGNDRLEGGAGADQLYGGNGIYDTATYVNATSGITLNLTNPLLNGGDALGDTFFSIEIYEGSRLNDTMVGSAGADIFTALEGDDTLQGMAGDDTLAPGLGTNIVDGGDGFDIVNYYNINAPVTVVGIGSGYLTTAGPLNTPIVADTLTNVEQIDGTPYGDTMLGGDANDIFVGRDGNDILDGGASDDTLVGGAGADTLRGGAGTGDRASYVLSAVGVTASLLNPGVNTGEAAGDTYQDIEGLRGSDYNDNLSGDNAANLLQGGIGDDVLNGNDGGDTLQGGVGGDTLNGGNGQDIASYYNSTSWVVLDLQNRANDENDSVGDSFTSIEIYQGTRFSDTMTGSNGIEQLWGEEGNDRLHGMGGNDYLSGAAGADQIWGDAGDDIIEGGADGDQISGGTGIDSIQGGTEADTIHGDEDGDFLNGDSGDDYVYGDAGNDAVSGDAGADHVYGGDNNDTVSGGDGDDFVFGDAGDDTVTGGQGNDVLDGGTGRDRVTYTDSGATAGIVLNLSTIGQTIGGTFIVALSAVDGFGTVDTIMSAASSGTIEDATGSMLADKIVAHEGGSNIDALDGDDVVLGLGGNDVIKGGAGVDTIDGGDGDDTVNGGEGGDDLKGGAGTDWLTYETLNGRVNANLKTGIATDWANAVDTFTGFENLRGGIGNDTLTGDDGVNVIEGGVGNDIIDGGIGGDTMRGGAGDDIIYVDQIGSDGDRVEDGDGRDLIRTSVDMMNGGVPWLFSGEDFQLIGSARIAHGNNDSNHLMGNALDNVLNGQGGADTFWGYAGDDIYVFDSINDSIGIGTEARALTAGDGEEANGGNDTIRLATSLIYNGSFLNPTLYTYSLNRIDLAHVENIELTDNDRRVDLTGNAANNRLVGNSWGQILRGEEGDDTLDPGTGRDSVNGGAGFDTLRIDWSSVNDYALDTVSFNGTLAGGYYGNWNSSPDFQDRNRVDFDGIERFEIKAGQLGDIIHTGDADDIIAGNGGNDVIYSRQGIDIIDGGDGIDLWNADKGAATALQPIVIDLTSAGIQSTYMGTGTVRGIERLQLTTGAGDDRITTLGSFQNDSLTTGDGADVVKIAGGRDDVHMGSQPNGTVDTLVIDWSSVVDYAFDSVSFNGTLAGGYHGNWNASPDFQDRNRVDFDGIERFEIKAGQLGDIIHTGDADDIIAGNGGDDVIYSRQGIDIIDGGTGIDLWNADKSAATALQPIVVDLTSSGIQSTYMGTGTVRGIERLELTTGAGDDRITTLGTFQNDSIATGAGDDIVKIAGGKDSIALGAGFDTLVIDWSSVLDYAFDTASFYGTLADGYYGNWNASPDFQSRNRVDFTGVERFEIKGGQFGDLIHTGDADDIVAGNAGDDVIYSRKGVDIIDGGDGTDVWNADKGAATAGQPIVIDLTLAGIQSTYMGIGTVRGIERLELTTGGGDDRITTLGSFLADNLTTGAGDDIVKIAGGKDVVAMGDGNDTLVIDWSAVLDYAFDSVTFNGTLAAGYYGNWNSSPDFGFRNRVDFTGVERFEIKAGQMGDIVVTGDGNDIVAGNDGDDAIYTRQGVDIIDGGNGIDLWNADKGAATAAQAIVIDLTLAGLQSTYMGTGTVRGIERLELTTGAGDDRITTLGSFLNDNLTTGAGDDIVKIAGGKDTVALGAGSDTLIIDWSLVSTYALDVFGLTGTLAGGYSGEWRAGTDFQDRNRVDFSGVERFEIKASTQSDVIEIGDGDDIVFAGAGNDYINSRKGADQIDGGAGTADRWNADKSAATVGMTIDLAGASTYTMPTGAGSVVGIEALGTQYGNWFQSGSGDDTIVTLSTFLNDFIATNDGADRVVISGGRDDIRMGGQTAGTVDTLVIDWSSVVDYAFDTASFNGTLAGGYYGSWNASPDFQDRNRVDYDGVERFEISAGQLGDIIHTGDADDIVAGNGGDDVIYSRKGVDIIDGGAGTDLWNADKSDATAAQAFILDLTLSGIQLTYMGTGTVRGIERVELTTGAGNDRITTRSDFLNDTLVTGAGDDIVIFRAGRDVAVMGDGTDTLVIDWRDGAGSLTAFYAGTLATGYSGNIRTDIDYSTRNRVDFSGVEKFDITGGAGNDDIYGAGGDDRLLGWTGNDTIRGDAGNDLIDGGIGDDTMIGGAGDDSYTVDSLGDVVTEEVNGGIDSVQTALVAYTLGANLETLTGTSTLYGQNLTGNALDNVISGTGFGDTLNGGAGNDTLYGGAGNDFFVAGKGTNDQIFGDGGTDTVVIDGTLANWEFVQLAGGVVRMTDLRDAANSVAFLTSIERVEITGIGSVTIAQAIAGNAAAPAPGTTGNDIVVLTLPALIDLSQGGEDTGTGSSDTDAFYFGAALSAGDNVNGGAGLNDQLAIQGNYNYTFSPVNLVEIETLSILSGSVTGLGDAGGNLYNYTFNLPDGSLASGRVLVIGASTLLAGENLVFDASAETDAQIFSFGGKGDDVMTGGAKIDAFYFGDDGRFTPADRLNGGAGPGDQLGLRGDYSTLVTFLPTTMTGIETISLISWQQAGFGAASRPSAFNLKLDDANVAAGQLLTVGASTLLAEEWVIFDGSAETNAPFFLIGGKGNDTLIGGADDDRLYGNLGADVLRGNGGADTYIYRSVAESTTAARDTIESFVHGDHIDLSFITTPRPDGAFEFIGSAAFTAAGQVRAEYVGGVWTIQANVDADLGADMAITVQQTNGFVWTATDFIL